MTCKSCKYLAVPPNKAGKIIAYRTLAYHCDAPLPTLLAFPHSVTEAYGFTWPPRKSWMTGGDGEGCPAYQPRKAKVTT